MTTFAVRMIVAAGVAGDLGAFDAGGAGREIQVVHRDQNPPLRRLQPVAHVGQAPAADDHAHRVGEVAVLQLLFDRQIDDAPGAGRRCRRRRCFPAHRHHLFRCRRRSGEESFQARWDRLVRWNQLTKINPFSGNLLTPAIRPNCSEYYAQATIIETKIISLLRLGDNRLRGRTAYHKSAKHQNLRHGFGVGLHA